VVDDVHLVVVVEVHLLAGQDLLLGASACVTRFVELGDVGLLVVVGVGLHLLLAPGIAAGLVHLRPGAARVVHGRLRLAAAADERNHDGKRDHQEGHSMTERAIRSHVL
jgi:hypothetical protein